MKIGDCACTACGFPRAVVTEGRGGTLSIKCMADDCGAQTFVKSPAAVLKLRARLGVPPPGWIPETPVTSGC